MHETLKVHTFTTIKSDSMEASWMGFLHEYAMKFYGNIFVYETVTFQYMTKDEYFMDIM